MKKSKTKKSRGKKRGYYTPIEITLLLNPKTYCKKCGSKDIGYKDGKVQRTFLDKKGKVIQTKTIAVS